MVALGPRFPSNAPGSPAVWPAPRNFVAMSASHVRAAVYRHKFAERLGGFMKKMIGRLMAMCLVHFHSRPLHSPATT